MDRTWPVEASSVGACAVGTRLWRGPSTRHLTVVVKATLDLVHDGAARVVPSDELVAQDRHYHKSPGRSVEVASEIAPYLARCDVTLRGHAHAPPGQPSPAIVARLLLSRTAPILDKRVYVVGDRDATTGETQPVQSVPLDYEHAFGGLSSPENPVGQSGEGRRARTPNVLDPTDARRPIGLAPVSRFWPQRTALLGKTPRAKIDADEPEIGDGFDWRYFQAAPADQQVPYLAGDEWIVLDGMHPALARFATRLPGVRGAAMVYAFSGGVCVAAKPIALELDTLAIDADRLTATIVFRGSMVLDVGVEPAHLKAYGGLEIDGAKVAWPDARTLEPPRVGTAAPAVATPIDGGETRMLAPEDAHRAAIAKADPFSRTREAALPGAAAPKPPDGPPSFGDTQTVDDAGARSARALPFGAPPAKDRPAAPVDAPAFVEPPAGAAPAAEPPIAEPDRVDFSSTYKQSPDDEARAAAEKVVPFAAAPRGARPPIAEPTAPSEKFTPDFGSTVTLDVANLDELKRAFAPFEIAEASPSLPARARAVPRRVSPQVPVVNPTTLGAVVSSWQLAPPQDVMSVLVKGTFDLVHGGAATLRDESDPPTGDLHADDDPQLTLVYASDFAVVKPRVDVVLTGHAHAPGKSSARARVTFRFGVKERGFARSIDVVGDRAWKRAAIAIAPGDPAPFEVMPIVYDRAFGGPSHAANPLGTGIGGTPPPNLEDPARPISSPSDAPAPACFAPIPQLFRERWSKLGTFDAAWLAARWPYFPADFDATYFQSAPRAQQVERVDGAESFEILGMRAEQEPVSGTLPGLRVRAFALTRPEHGARFFEIPMRIDTVAFDVDELKVNLVWRGLLDTIDDEASELETLFVHAEPMAAAPTAIDELRELLLDAVTPDDAAEEAPDALALAPPPRDPDEIAALRAHVIERLAAGDALDGEDLAGADLADLDLSGRSFADAILKGAKLDGARLDGANFAGAVLASASFVGASLAAANLAGADLVGARLEGVNLDGADLTDADLSLAHAARATFRATKADGAQLAGADLAEARFDGAALAGADFTDAKLNRASFEGAVMPGARFYYAKGEGARFDGADLTEGRCDDAELVRCSFASVRAASSVWEKAKLTGSSFARADLTASSFARAACGDVNFSGAALAEGRFQRGDFAHALFAKANLCEADFERADLTMADLRGANLHGAETWKAKLAGANFDGSVLTRSALKGSRG